MYGHNVGLTAQMAAVVKSRNEPTLSIPYPLLRGAHRAAMLMRKHKLRMHNQTARQACNGALHLELQRAAYGVWSCYASLGCLSTCNVLTLMNATKQSLAHCLCSVVIRLIMVSCVMLTLHSIIACLLLVYPTAT